MNGKLMGVVAILALFVLLAFGFAQAGSCQLGEATVDPRSGVVEHKVFASDNATVGVVRQAPEGHWDAVVHNLGALNEKFFTPQKAAEAVCAAIRQ